MFPRDVIPVNNLATQYVIFGQTEKAIPLAQKAIQLEPELQVPYAVLAAAYQGAGNWNELSRSLYPVQRKLTYRLALETWSKSD